MGNDLAWASRRALFAGVANGIGAALCGCALGWVAVGLALGQNAHHWLVVGENALRIVGYAQTVLMALWAYAALYNARTHLRATTAFAPAMGAASFFIPFASVVLPFMILHDLRKASDADAFPPRTRTVAADAEGYRTGATRDEAIAAPRVFLPIALMGAFAGVRFFVRLASPIAMAVLGRYESVAALTVLGIVADGVVTLLMLLSVLSIDRAQRERGARIEALAAAAP